MANAQRPPRWHGPHDARQPIHTLSLAPGAFTLCEVGVYSLEDWEKLYDAYQQGAIAYPWVAGPRDATMAGEKGPWGL